MKKNFLWLRALLSIGLIAFLFYTVDVQETFAVLTRANFSFLLIAFMIAMGDRVLMAYKWNVLLRVKGISISLINVTGIYLISTFLGLFLPATVGGDALRAYAVTREGHRGSDVVSSIIVERILGFVALFIFVLISIVLSIFVFGQSFFAGIWNLFWLFALLLVAACVFIAISLNDSILRRLNQLLKGRNVNVGKYKVAQKLEEIYHSYQSYQDHMAYLVAFFFLSLLENLFPLFWTYFLSLAFNIDVPLLYFFILIPIVLALIRLPISLDGIGIQEGAFVYFLALIGVARSEALFLGIVSHLLGILSVLPGGFLYSIHGLSFYPNRDGKGMEELLQAGEVRPTAFGPGVELTEDAANEASGV